ncbi:MAG: hypothetical protein H9901_00360 [Candidatus Paralactobacillus gallistercoris]|uniref:Uncharacterized protein n=1 Tax=Candidatus Paralactobacillus gallistercoris TaxID=2838724 RepID=A0A948TI20_9LACO|nr:hypothetical protein [Candidatus Paralactobacillus gallistercoris]
MAKVINVNVDDYETHQVDTTNGTIKYQGITTDELSTRQIKITEVLNDKVVSEEVKELPATINFDGEEIQFIAYN